LECTNPSPSEPESLTFATFEIETKKEYGEFDLKTGLFTVKKSGIFQFNFSGLADVSNGSRTHDFELMVDGESKSMSFLNMTVAEGYQPVSLSAFLQLMPGQKVSMNLFEGALYDNPKTRATRFSSVFFS